MASIGLIAAMAQERDALLRRSREWKKGPIGEMQGYRMDLSGNSLFLAASGMGVKRAARAARMMVEAASVDSLVSFGIAGAVEESLQIGDVVLVDNVCQLEEGIGGRQIPLQRWNQASREQAERMLARRGVHLFSGTAITTGGSQVAPEKLGELAHPVLEMETMAIAQVAAELGIPFLAVRSISDGPNQPIPFDLGEMMDENANMRVGKLLGQIVRHPKILGKLGRMAQNSRIAEENAANALVELLRNQFMHIG